MVASSPTAATVRRPNRYERCFSVAYRENILYSPPEDHMLWSTQHTKPGAMTTISDWL